MARLVIDFTKGGADNPQLIAALEAAHARDHELVTQLRQAEIALQEGRRAFEQQNELLRTRTIERDHAREDAHLWSLCLAHLVNEGAVTSLPAADVNAMEGQMLSAEVEDGIVHLFVRDRPQASEEGRAADG